MAGDALDQARLGQKFDRDRQRLRVGWRRSRRSLVASRGTAVPSVAALLAPASFALPTAVTATARRHAFGFSAAAFPAALRRTRAAPVVVAARTFRLAREVGIRIFSRRFLEPVGQELEIERLIGH